MSEIIGVNTSTFSESDLLREIQKARNPKASNTVSKPKRSRDSILKEIDAYETRKRVFRREMENHKESKESKQYELSKLDSLKDHLMAHTRIICNVINTLHIILVVIILSNAIGIVWAIAGVCTMWVVTGVLLKDTNAEVEHFLQCSTFVGAITYIILLWNTLGVVGAIIIGICILLVSYLVLLLSANNMDEVISALPLSVSSGVTYMIFLGGNIEVRDIINGIIIGIIILFIFVIVKFIIIKIHGVEVRDLYIKIYKCEEEIKEYKYKIKSYDNLVEECDLKIRNLRQQL